MAALLCFSSLSIKDEIIFKELKRIERNRKKPQRYTQKIAGIILKKCDGSAELTFFISDRRHAFVYYPYGTQYVGINFPEVAFILLSLLYKTVKVRRTWAYIASFSYFFKTTLQNLL